MNELIRLYLSIERTLLAFVELNCYCGGRGKVDPTDHMEYCPYWQALDRASDSTAGQQEKP
jgi:hypothetical protein